MLAQRGLGRVEPNPAVGAVIVDPQLNKLGEGFHEYFGGPHAEITALNQAGTQAEGATLYVTLEPCAHVGKTGACTATIHKAGIKKVIIATSDPARHTNIPGLEMLRTLGIEAEVGLLQDEAKELIKPFTKKILTGFPFVLAKWAMTLDGKIATHTGHSQWISNEQSRSIVHRLRGRVDGILVGSQTALADDPLLTARPPGPRIATRIVLDSHARLPLTSQLVQTAGEIPLLVAVAQDAADPLRIEALQKKGAEVLRCPLEQEHRIDIATLLKALAARGMTNILIEGGSVVLGTLFDQQLIDEYHVFISPKIAGGRAAKTAMAGQGLNQIPELSQLAQPEIMLLSNDIYVHGRAGEA